MIARFTFVEWKAAWAARSAKAILEGRQSPAAREKLRSPATCHTRERTRPNWADAQTASATIVRRSSFSAQVTLVLQLYQLRQLTAWYARAPRRTKAPAQVSRPEGKGDDWQVLYGAGFSLC